MSESDSLDKYLIRVTGPRINIYVVFVTSGTLTPDGTVSLDCESQQTFTCSVTGTAALWAISGLSGIGATRYAGTITANLNARITTTDSGITTPSTITITGFTTSDNGGTIQCFNPGDGIVQGMASISVGENLVSGRLYNRTGLVLGQT